MEMLLHYIWKHKILPLKPLFTTAGLAVEVIDPGLQNRNSGPDFFNAKVKIGDTMWVGNVEIHDKASAWYVHGHDKDSHYANVILHVAGIIDAEVKTSAGNIVQQVQLDVPPAVIGHYRELITADRYPPCHTIIPTLGKLMLHSWMSALQTERLERKTHDIRNRLARCNGDWESAYFVTMARNYGFGINGDAFEAWAFNIPLLSAAHHRDNIFQIEALFMGQAGLLDIATVPSKYREEALRDGYLERLGNEYAYLARKFGLSPVDSSCWRFLRLRPQNFPHIRIAQLATLYCSRKAGLAQLLDCRSVAQMQSMFSTRVTPYWETHYAFGSVSNTTSKCLSRSSLNLLMINTAIPILFAYGQYIGSDELRRRATGFLEQLEAENNHIVRMWKECGLTVENAGDTQALIHLKNEYCDRKDCLRCRFGYEYLKKQ